MRPVSLHIDQYDPRAHTFTILDRALLMNQYDPGPLPYETGLFVHVPIRPETVTATVCLRPHQLYRKIVLHGQKTSKRHAWMNSPLLWEWHGKVYLGAAHGVAGVLHVLMQVSIASACFTMFCCHWTPTPTPTPTLIPTPTPTPTRPSVAPPAIYFFGVADFWRNYLDKCRIRAT